jgi:hypothetical protein
MQGVVDGCLGFSILVHRETVIADHCCAVLQYLKETIWVEHCGLLTQIMVTSQQLPPPKRVTVQSWCSFTADVLPICHTTWLLHQANSTSQDHRRSILKKNTSGIIRSKLRYADGCKHFEMLFGDYMVKEGVKLLFILLSDT